MPQFTANTLQALLLLAGVESQTQASIVKVGKLRIAWADLRIAWADSGQHRDRMEDYG
jgi:hypothetical protein